MTNENFNDFYERYFEFSKGLVLNVVDNLDTAQDITQDVFLHFYTIKERLDFSDEKRLGALVRKATFNKTMDFYRKGYVKREICAMDALYSNMTIDNGYNIEAEMLGIEEEEYLRLVFQRLRNDNLTNYDIFIKVKILDFPPESVAKEYHYTVNNVNNRIMRTRRWLKEELDKLKK